MKSVWTCAVALALSSFPAIAEEVFVSAPDGAALYADHCQVCHGRKGNGRGPASWALKPKPTDFSRAEYWTLDVEARGIRVLKSGIVNTSMRAYSELADAEKRAVIAYLGLFQPPAEGGPDAGSPATAASP